MATNTPKLILTHPEAGGVVFYIPQELALGYASELRAIGVNNRSHVQAFIFRGGRVKNFVINLDLIVGSSYKIDHAKELLGVIEKLWSFAIPDWDGMVAVGMRACNISIRGNFGQWFSCKAFVTDVNAVMTPPVDIETGMYMHAKVAIEVIPTYSDTASLKGKWLAPIESLPRRPWKFSSQSK